MRQGQIIATITAITNFIQWAIQLIKKTNRLQAPGQSGNKHLLCLRSYLSAVALASFAVVLISTGCMQNNSSPPNNLQFVNVGPALPDLPAELLPITVESIDLLPSAGACQDTFISHPLDHITAIAGDVVHLFESNGAGLAINDLDNDGDQDIVLANLAGPNAIFWNEGKLRFRKETLPHGDSRAVNIVDVDGDGWLDIVFARRNQIRLAYWRNNGLADKRGFTYMDLIQAKNPYTMSWADLDGDDDLDLVLASYDAEWEKTSGYLEAFAGGGVMYYENRGESFELTYLTAEAQTLAILLVDLNEDGHLDILVGNDFFLPDQVWLRQADGWQEDQPFSATTQNTMSFDAADIDNDGQVEILATDMKPYANDSETMAAWAPLMGDMHLEEHSEDDTVQNNVLHQVMENVLQVWDGSGDFENRAVASGLDATGWSWSSKFGDLDNDGYLDVYVVNGMVAVEMFGHLQSNELVEENQVLRNNGQGQFEPMPGWGLNSTASGRGMSMADLDQDGDLDIVINNLLSTAQIFENRLCVGSAFEIDLFWPTSKNTRAIGAELILHTTTGSYHRQVKAASGYLSGDSSRIHFGLPSDSIIRRLDVHWPDGAVSSLGSQVPKRLLIITRE